ncbi:hypothetical protein BABINDRAFT_159981 [Babjeviella inositovora NRRL Y-12698]|uniref:Ubiquitin carboxyl-terminal hydrolase n=1 Tax=Babjeviella inositovora NRRL Y-12698 TaxID=984486 RepID=A0A1E3QVX7_9ASCO|nr:uncharacterized protein BABINDRAFT_159981 [Babjeviella inositovora NRRL Y-12698]ODQ81734.1 hypothetical protein BABINDRAFT_159981 [Babjeviella inositovora NRRL Y-12698]
MPKSVVPIESNPEIFTALAHKLGVSPLLEFHDVFSISESDLLAMIPNPAYALVLLFPLTVDYEAQRKEQDAQRPTYANENLSVRWVKQTIKNGCGFYALLHAALNLPDSLVLYNSQVQSLKKASVSGRGPLSVAEVSELVERMESKAYDDLAQQGSTAAPDADEDVLFHFLCFVKGRDGHIYELDGRRNGPVDLGEFEGESADIVSQEKVRGKIQYYMDNADEANKHNFSIMALAPGYD